MESPRELSPAEIAERSQQRLRRRALVLFATLVVLLHAMLLGGSDWDALGPNREPAAGTPMKVRSIEVQPVEAPLAPVAIAKPAAAPPPASPKPRRPRFAASRPTDIPARAVEPPAPLASEPVVAEAAVDPEPLSPQASSPPAADPAASAASTAASAGASEAASEAVATAASAGASEAVATAASAGASEAVATAASAPAAAASSSFLAAGELPPPTYRTKLPPSVTMRYEVRRGFFRGTGEIRWQHVGDDYGLRLEARIAGLTLLAQTSQGVVDATGLAPVRFLDQRARRSAQAANFRRDADTITFSGPSVVWPLLPGTQDQLSWMIQLAGIVAAEPERASDGGRISMVIVGARGDASVRTLRFAGRENATTASGDVPALKFVVDARSTYDSSYEIWLDPARDYLPAHATRRNGAGESEFDLLLERIEPIP